MDKAIQHGFTPVIPPDLVHKEVVDACGFLPRSSDPQMYFVERGNKALCATAEFPLAAMYANEVLMEKQLPLKMV